MKVLFAGCMSPHLALLGLGAMSNESVMRSKPDVD